MECLLQSIDWQIQMTNMKVPSNMQSCQLHWLPTRVKCLRVWACCSTIIRGANHSRILILWIPEIIHKKECIVNALPSIPFIPAPLLSVIDGLLKISGKGLPSGAFLLGKCCTCTLMATLGPYNININYALA